MLPGMVEQPDLAVRLLRYLLRLLIQLPLFIAIYVLSIGPLFWYWYESAYVGGSKLWFVIYYPLMVACENETIRYFVNRYIDWWIL
jgi:hypothetical protein